MEKIIVFDCYQTLVYKDGLEKAIRDFIFKKKNRDIGLRFISRALDLLYYRHKFNHPKFKNKKGRKKFYLDYNRELMETLGIEAGEDFLEELNIKLSALPYKIYPDVKEILSYFADSKVKLGLLANWTESLDKVLDSVGIKKYFYFKFSSDFLGSQKPNISFFKKGLKSVLNNNYEVFYIGDDFQLDMAPAKKIGIKTVLIDRDGRFDKNIDCVKIKSLKSLKSVIKHIKY